MEGRYCLAGVAMEVSSIYAAVHDLMRDYRYLGRPSMWVRTTQEDISFERARSERRGFSDAYLEELAVYRKIAEQMPYRDTFLFHGSVVAVDGVAYAFAAPSGTGKSTHARLWRELLGNRAQMVNDDKPLLRVTQDGVLACGTPWDGKHHLSTNAMVPLAAICLLERCDSNHIECIDAAEAYPGLLQQTYRPLDGVSLAKTLDLLDAATRVVGLYRLRCNMDVMAARMAYQELRKENP